jgi:hypothetical protein
MSRVRAPQYGRKGEKYGIRQTALRVRRDREAQPDLHPPECGEGQPKGWSTPEGEPAPKGKG